jgi:DNA/RNA-binding domain of Phe-tRNA-synthetase-like protein
MISFQIKPGHNFSVGVITALGVDVSSKLPVLEKRLNGCLQERKNELSENEDLFRKAVRDMMRIGSYKPTGRAKPASEYLIRAASEDQFPRINTVVDINNYISLRYLVPISMWDLDKADSDSILFRPGNDGEEYIFNPSGQTLSLKDLITGFAVKNGDETPIISPVKDCQMTKTDGSTRNIGVAVYYPANRSGEPELQQILDEFCELLELISEKVVQLSE